MGAMEPPLTTSLVHVHQATHTPTMSAGSNKGAFRGEINVEPAKSVAPAGRSRRPVHLHLTIRERFPCHFWQAAAAAAQLSCPARWRSDRADQAQNLCADRSVRQPDLSTERQEDAPVQHGVKSEPLKKKPAHVSAPPNELQLGSRK